MTNPHDEEFPPDKSPPPISWLDAEVALRRRAEILLAEANTEAMMAASPEAAARLLHELQVHQIELELQNEELRRTQQELESARARYFDLYNMAPVGYVTLSAQGLIQEANLTAATVLEVPRGAMLRRPLSQFVAPEDQDIYYQHHRRLVNGGGSQVCELRMLRTDHPPFWARLEATVILGATGKAAMYRVVMTNISLRIAAEESVRELNATLERRVEERTAALQASEANLRRTNSDLERALRLKDEFLAMMSHELRTPLSIVLSITEALTEEIYGPLAPAQRKALSSLRESGRHLLAVLSDILDLSSITVGREKLDVQPVNVDLLCRMALQMVEPAAQAKGIPISYTMEMDITDMRADEHRLTQILVNLLSNAVKFTPEGGAVGLEVVRDATRQQILFSVWDNGAGIAPADQERIFEPFVQVDARLARQYGGVGLGLALVQRLAVLHNGSVSLSSALGKGSRFTVRIPWANVLQAAR